jgi:hypothetical protein
MDPHFFPNHRRSMASAAEATRQARGIIQQPGLHGMIPSPATLFWAGFATGLAWALCENRPDEKA